jgi:hypothetical protein
MIETFMHTFPATPVSSAYEALAVRHGFNAYPVVTFEGRQCYVFNSFRCFGGKGRGYHNRVQVKFLDNDEIRSVPCGEFAKKAKSPSLTSQERNSQ